jgi:hypothetical protein
MRMSRSAAHGDHFQHFDERFSFECELHLAALSSNNSDLLRRRAVIGQPVNCIRELRRVRCLP